jgi:DNA processing protein
MREPAVSARAMCVWLGTLATYRPAFVRQLELRYRTTAQVLARPPEDIVEFATRRRRAGIPSVGDRAASRSATEAESDAGRFLAVLREGPAACLQRAERRPPGDLVVAWSEALYPDQLRDLGDPPLCLFVRGGASSETVAARMSAIVDAPIVSVVGARAPSPYGEEMARSISAGLARAGVIVASGMAMGIDAVAQTAAVEVEASLEPATVAVLGCGADVVYPRCNTRLYARAVADGLVLSEFAWGVPARGWRFPARNRVIAALARAVVLVEGAQRSGARITASHGAELGREVLCVPGEAGRKLSQAPNRLLGHGAHVCESAMDVLDAIKYSVDGSGARLAAGSAADVPVVVLDHGGGAIRDVLGALNEAAFTIDQLAVRCGLTVAKAASAVSDLEVEGLARRVEGGRYRLMRR